MHEFSWDETDESLSDYYSRYAGMFKGKDRFLAGSSVMLVAIGIGLIAGGALAYVIGRNLGTLMLVGVCVTGALAAGFAGFVVGAAINERVCKRVLGTTNFNLLD